MAKKLCVIGGGRWGQNHIRTLFEMRNLGAIVESNEARLSELLLKFPVKGFSNVDEAITNGFDGYIVATPAETHYSIGLKLLNNGCHTLIEKPLALSSKDASELIRAAEISGASLMVGHILMFHPAIQKIKEVVESGKIGQLYYLYSTRLNLGTVRTEENVFWSFAPHDISVLDYIVGHPSIEINVIGGKYLQDTIDDFTMTQFIYPNNVKAHIFVSWLHPFKEQRLVIVGSKGMISFDDSSKEKNIMFYNKRVEWNGGIPSKVEQLDEIIEYEKSQPLMNELKYFIENSGGKIEMASGINGLEVVKILEKAQEQLNKENTYRNKDMNLDINTNKKEYFVHETSFIDEDVLIGKGTKIWHFSHIQKGSRIGENCSFGQNVNVGNNVKIGSNCKIQNNVSIYEGVELEDYVFCGPSMVFTNIKAPRCKYPQRGTSFYYKTLLKEGVCIGANATIVCGHTIGRHAFVAAGAVVAADVPDYALMMGVPAKQKGWVCECGEILKGEMDYICSKCNRKYYEENGLLKEI